MIAFFDIVLVVMLIIAGIKGFQRGFIVELISMLAFFLGLFLALKLTFPIALRFFGKLEAFWLIALVIFILLFFVVMWGAKMLANAIKKGIDPTVAGTMDSVLGVALSVVKWIFVFSVILWVVDSLEIDIPKDWTNDSHLYYPLTSLAPWTIEILSGVIPFFQDILDTMDAPPRRV